MIDWFLIIVCIVFSLLSLFIGFYTVIHFQHPEDKNKSWFCKIIVTLGLGVSAMNVLLLPLDSLNRASGNTLDISLMCWIFTIASAALAFVVIPFTASLYENFEDEECKHPICKALFGVIPFVLFVIIFFLILWFAVGRCEVPIERHAGVLVTTIAELDAGTNCRSLDTIWNITPSAISYIIAMIGFIGYLLLIVLGGIGLVTLPFNLFENFINRARPISLRQYAKGQECINRWATELVTEGNILNDEGRAKGWKNRKIKKRVIKYEQQVEYLENAYNVIERSYKLRGGSPIWPWLSLFAGIIGIIITIVWVIHIIFYTLLNMHPFLNQYLVLLDNVFSWFSVITFGLFVYYLYWAVLSGVTTFGLNLLVIKVHKMEVENTPMNSILFNTAVMLFASFGVSLFATMNFPIYTRLTSLEMIYGTQVKLLAGLKYVWEYGLYVLLGCFVIALIVKLFTCTRKKENRVKDIKKALELYDTNINE